jgi:hypothetical protein
MNTCAVEADLNIRRFVSAVFVHDDRILVDEQISGHCKTTHEISQSPACVVLRQLSMRRRLNKFIRIYRANRQAAVYLDSRMITVILIAFGKESNAESNGDFCFGEESNAESNGDFCFGEESNAESNGDFCFVRFVLFGTNLTVEGVLAQW